MIRMASPCAVSASPCAGTYASNSLSKSACCCPSPLKYVFMIIYLLCIVLLCVSVSF